MNYDKDELFQPIYKAILANFTNPKWKIAINRAKHKMGMATCDLGDIYEMAGVVWNKPTDFPDLFKLINLK
jgi:hypothetical protein